MKDKIILGIAAHPDDLDFGCSATIAKWVKEGALAYYLILTDGSKGYSDHKFPTEQLIKIRQEEQKSAGNHLGLAEVFFLDFVDGELENNHQVKKQVVKIIRTIKPNIVFTTDPTKIFDAIRGYINHPDHRNAGLIALESVFPFSRNSRTYPELMDEGLGEHKVEEVYLVSPNSENTNFYVDITDTMDQKLKALKEHKSQHDDQESIQEYVKNRASEIGEKISVQFAEGFVQIKITS